MKSTEFLTRLTLIFFIKNINGQHNALVYNENCECNSPETIQQPIPTYAIVKTMQDILNQNENTAALPNNGNQHKMRTEYNTPPSSADTQRIRLPPDLQQQPLQVQQYLQLEKPLQIQQAPPSQQALPLQQHLQLQPQTQVQPLTQSQLSFDTIQPLTPLQAQDILQLQPFQKQTQLQTDKSLQSYQPVQPLQSLELQQLIQSKQSLQTPQPLQQPLQSHDSSQPLQTIQQPLGFQQYYPQTPFTKDTTFTQNINNNQPNSQIHVKWQSSNPLGAINVENPYNTQNFNIQPLQTSIKSPVEVIAPAQKYKDKPQETPSLRYYIVSQLPASPSVSAPIVSNCHSVASKPNIKSIEEAYVPLTAPYNYMIPSPPNQSTNTKLHYYNQATDSQKNTYINQNSGFRFPEQSTLPVVLQSQPTAFVPSQSSMLPATPISIRQAPTISSQHAVSSGYPVVAPAYTRNKSVSSTLKSILPIIFQLLKEKIATCGCSNDCPCECKNDRSDNELDVACGYTSQKDCGHFAKDALSVLDTVSEEEQGPECLREPKNCEEIKNATLETSDEIIEEEGCDEEEFDEDEET